MGERICLEDLLLKQGSQQDPLGSTVSGWNKERTSRLEHHLQTRMGSLSPGAYAPQHCLYPEKRVSKVFPSTSFCWDDDPWTPFYENPFRVPICRDFVDCWRCLQGECAVAPHILPCRQQDECMRELHQELTMYMARTGLEYKSGLARSTARGRRCSHSHSVSQACSPSAGPWGMELAKWLKEDTPTWWSGLRRHSHTWARDRLRWHKNPYHQFPGWCQSPSLSSPWSCPADGWLSCSMKDLNLQPRSCKSRSRVQ